VSKATALFERGVASRNERSSSDWKRTERDLSELRCELEDEAARLASERRDFEDAQAAWSRERATIDKQLAEQSERLVRERVELKLEHQTLEQSRDEWITEWNEREAEWERRNQELNQYAEELALTEAALVRRETDLEKRLAEFEARWQEFCRQRERWESARTRQSQRPPEENTDVDEESAEPAPPPRPVKIDVLRTAEDQGPEEPHLVGAPPTRASGHNQDDLGDELADEIGDDARALAGLVRLAECKTRWQRVKAACARWLRIGG
jgi:hypothetical protein